MFDRASNFQINGGNFLQPQGDVNFHSKSSEEEEGRSLVSSISSSLQIIPHCLPSQESSGGQAEEGFNLLDNTLSWPQNSTCPNEGPLSISTGSSTAYLDPASAESSASILSINPSPMTMLDPAFQEPGYSLSGSVRQNKQSRAARKRPYDTSWQAGILGDSHPQAPNSSVDGYEQVNAPLISSSHNLAYPSSFQGTFLPVANPSQANFHGGTFIDGNVNYIQQHGESGLQILFKATAPGAFHDSAARFPQPKCHPETRKEILEKLFQWCSTRDAPNILWLHGPAGAGKSAIAQSLCERLESEKRLGASFFFKRGDTLRGNGNRLFPTIAYQLALHLPEINNPISRVVRRNPAIVEKSLSIQLKNLIMGPCKAVLSGRTQPIIIIIDGLDECEGEQIQQALLCTIGDATHEDIPLRFLITSRPEAHIQETFGGPLKSVHRPFNINQSFDDVEKYLQDELSRIYHEHSDTMATVPTPWPPSHIVRELVDKSSGYFVYASTVIKFIDDKDFRPPERLAVILANKNTEFDSPFGALDQLYLDILSTVPKAHCFHLIAVLMIAASEQLPKNLKVSVAEELLELQPGDTRRILRRLRSLINIDMCSYGIYSEEDTDVTLNTSIFHHASFLDFLEDSTRSKHFFINQPQHKTRLAHYMLKAFSYDEVRIWIRACKEYDGVSYAEAIGDRIEFITSVPPSADLTSLLYSFNPVFLFLLSQSKLEVLYKVVLEWLQVHLTSYYLDRESASHLFH
ncbi:hypothetical protein B0H13DRAFT_1037254 [Mycena leptocephala]|nr:hypothetical protein B0H13DRAFT_1037254 [Mycena leptocephala]